MDIPALKQCRKCDAPKPATLEYFYRKKTCKDGLTTLCKVHSNENHTTYVQNNREHIRAYKKKVFKKNRDHILTQQRTLRQLNLAHYRHLAKLQYIKHRLVRLFKQRIYYWSHREERLAYARTYQVTHGDMLRRKDRARWITRPPEQKVFRFKDWAKRNPEAYKECQRKWRAAHPDTIRRWNTTARAKRRLATFVDHVDHEYIAERDNWRCHLCKKKVTRKTWSIDHHFPVGIPGGIHGRQYVSLAHQRCNSRRGAGRPGFPAQLRLLP
jgi:hypothetical protein